MNSKYKFLTKKESFFGRASYVGRLFLITTVISLLMIIPSGCKKFVEVDPPVTSITGASVYNYDATAVAVLTGIYSKMSLRSNYGFGIGDLATISLASGLSADEFTLHSAVTNSKYIAYYRNNLSSTINGFEFWNSIYSYIFTCNSAIEGLNSSNSLTPSVKQQLIGEAKFMRGLFYFYLINLYGDVPLILTTDYNVNATLARSPKSQVYQQIIGDLKDAQNLLSINYLNAAVNNSTAERVRPNKWAATALLARVYLYTNTEWANAETQATAVISNSTMYSLTTLNNTFLKNSNEAIWQLQPVTTGWNTEDAKVFNLGAAPVGPSNTKAVYLSASLLNSFEIGDNRKTNWINSYTDGAGTYYYANKYKSATNGSAVTEYLMVLRLAEQYLIRAEARAKQNNLSGAIADIDMVRQRAGLPLIATTNPGINQTALQTAILHERQVELFTEWGHRWLDLKRTNTVDAVMTTATSLKGGTWNTNWQLYPIFIGDIQKDLNLTQNAGY